jgi:hypothetical protein
VAEVYLATYDLHKNVSFVLLMCLGMISSSGVGVMMQKEDMSVVAERAQRWPLFFLT